MTSYFECLNNNNKVIIDDINYRYIKSREITASGLTTIDTNYYSYGLSSGTIKFLEDVPSRNLFATLCRLTCPMNSNEHFIALNTDIYDTSIGYIVRPRIAGSNDAYVYVICSQAAAVTDIETIKAHLKIAFFSNQIPTDGNCGLRIYNSYGNMIFNSDYDIMSIRKSVFMNNMNGAKQSSCHFNTPLTRNEVIGYSDLCDREIGDFCAIQNIPGALYEHYQSRYNSTALFPMTGYITFTSNKIGLNFFIGRLIMYGGSNFAFDTTMINGDASNFPYYPVYNDTVNLFCLRS